MFQSLEKRMKESAKKEIFMKARFIFIILASLILASCSIEPELDSSILVPSEPYSSQSSDTSKALLDKAAGSSYSINGAISIVINYMEEDTFTLKKESDNYYLCGSLSDSNLQINLTNEGLFEIELEDYQQTYLYLNADASLLVLVADGDSYTYGRN